MVCTPIYCFSALKGKYLEPATSSHPIEAEGYEIHLNFIFLVKELNYSVSQFPRISRKWMASIFLS
jgi:hypothetical protein